MDDSVLQAFLTRCACIRIVASLATSATQAGNVHVGAFVADHIRVIARKVLAVVR